MQNLKFNTCVVITLLGLILFNPAVLFGKSRFFSNLKVKDGLPVNEVFTISQDSTGLIWMGTNNGIVCYDGYEMKVFRQGDSKNSPLPGNQITSIVHDKNLGFWLGSYEGLVWFDTQTNTMKQVNLGQPREIRCLLLQGDSLLWAGSANGLICLKTHDGSYTIYNDQNSNLGSNIVRSLYVDSGHNLWIGTFNGLNRLSPDGKMDLLDLKGKYKPELKNNLVLEIQPYSANNDSLLWIGTETGLVLLDRISLKTSVYHSGNTGFGNEVVKCIYPLENGQLYFGTDFGFYFFDSRSGKFEVSLHDPFNNYSLTNNVVWDIFSDRAGLLWLATANGISRLNTHHDRFRFTPVIQKIGNEQIGNQVNDLYCDPDQTLWLATKSGVFALFTDGNNLSFSNDPNSKHPLVFNNINTIGGDYLGRIWIGSAGGINVWDTEQNKMYTITASFNLNRGLRSNYISAFISPEDGSFWVSTWGGGLYKAKGNFENVDEISFEYIADFNTNILSSGEAIWLENKNKVYRIDLSTLQINELKQLNEIVGKRNINSLLITSKGELWVGLTKQLLMWNTQSEKSEIFNIIQGEEDIINNLTEDHQGNIWGSTLTSIFCFSPSTSQTDFFPMSKGIPLDVFLEQSFSRSHSGEISFGGNDGFISFLPSEIKKNLFCPKTIITGIKINNKPIEKVNELKGKNRSDKLITYADKIVLKYNQNSVSFSFSALHFGDPGRNLYAYQLEGYDDNWNYTSGFRNLATYSNLPPDRYLFKVKGSNNEGVWFDNEASLILVVKPPFWASAWAIALYLVVFQLVITMLFITYRNKVRYKAEINAITLEKEKNEELVRAKQQFFTNISHEFRTPLNLIIGPVQTLLTKHQFNNDIRSMLQLVSKNSRRLLSLVNQLMDIRKIENQSLELNLQPISIRTFMHDQYELFSDMAVNQQVEFLIEQPSSDFTVISDPDKLESIVQNLLSNAFKFTPAKGRIELKLEFPGEELMRLSVSDSGSGIAPEDQPYVFNRYYQGNNAKQLNKGYGIGLNLVKEYCEILRGKIGFESQPGSGTVFYVELPVQTGNIIPLNLKSQKLSVPIGKKTTWSDLSSSHSMPSILIADDHYEMLQYLELNLAGKYHVLSVSNGKEAINILEKYKIDLIISDVMMPVLDGFMLCNKIKSNPKYSGIPIILLTAATLTDKQIEGFRSGADDYLVKPFNPDVLEARIESLLYRNRKVEEYIKQQLIVGNQEIKVESHDEKLLQETIQYINEHLSDPEINIDRMCKAIGVSHSSLYRKIKQQTGLSLNELIRQVKIKRAAHLLKNKKLTIAEIMDETGFTNHSYFAKCFRKEFGLSPREYAEKHLG